MAYQHPTQFLYPIEKGVDYRLPENRMHLALAWQETLCYTEEHNQQLRLIYWAIDNEAGLDSNNKLERKLWAAFLWGCCYNLIGPWTIMDRFPVPPADMVEFSDWYNINFDRMRFDTDCRYRKSKMIPCVQSYVNWLGGRTQWEAFGPILSITDKQEQFQTLWDTCDSWKYFGRLSNWNTVEAIELATNHTFAIDIPSFMLTDVSGSESNRNGAAFLFNREDLLTKHGKLKTTGQVIAKEDCELLEGLAESAYRLSRDALGHISWINRLNSETSIFCWYKKFFRKNSTRYVGWDGERTYDELEYMSFYWPKVKCDALWAARADLLPGWLLCENYPEEVGGVQKWKMPRFFETGFPESIYFFQQAQRWEFEEDPGFVKSWTKVIKELPSTSTNLLDLM